MTCDTSGPPHFGYYAGSSRVCHNKNMLKQLILIIALFQAAAATGAAPWVGETLDGDRCLGDAASVGPYDYFDADDESDRLWEEARLWETRYVHLLPAQQALATKPFGFIPFDRASHEFDFLLRQFPNHPEALQGIIELELKVRFQASTGRRLVSKHPRPECYFQRGIAFRPQQPHLRLLFGIYLHRLKLFDKAVEQYLAAESLDADNAEVQYNMGLAYAELKQYDEAIVHAQRAYELGHPLPGLRRKLERAGRWPGS